MTDPQTAQIRDLNDAFRSTFLTGTVLITAGIRDLPEALRARVIERVRTFSEFTPYNDPHGEHDFGAFTIEGRKVFWKIDYYAPDMEHGSDNPVDPATTRRVLTIMLAEEY